MVSCVMLRNREERSMCLMEQRESIYCSKADFKSPFYVGKVASLQDLPNLLQG